MKSRAVWILSLLALVGGVWLAWKPFDSRKELAAPSPSAPPEQPAEPDARLVHPPAPTSGRAQAVVPEPAQAPEEVTQTARPRAIDLAELRGTIVLPDGSPAQGANIQLRGWEGNDERVQEFGLPDDWSDLSGATASDGGFSLAFAPPGAFQFVLGIKLPGFAEASWRWHELEPGSTTDVGRVELRDAGVVEGRIVYASGDPCPGDWHVYADSEVRTKGPGGDQTRVRAAADPDQGTFRLEDVPVGRVRLKAYSRIANWVEGPAIAVSAGQTIEADIVYRGPDNSRRITVVTFSRPFYIFDEPAAGSMVAIGPDGVRYPAHKIPQSSQSWSIDGLERGRYTVKIDDPAFEAWSESGVQPGQSIEAHLRPSASLALRIVDDRMSSPIEAYRLRTEFRFEDGSWRSPSVFEVRRLEEPLPAGGVYGGMVPHDQTLLVEAPGYALAQLDVDDLQPGEVRAVEVRLTPGARLSGRVTRSGQGVKDVSVALWPSGLKRSTDPFEQVDAELERQRQVSTTDLEGHFDFADVVPGAFDVEADQGPLITARLERVELEAGGSKEIQIDLPPTGSLMGRLVIPPSIESNDLLVRVWPAQGPRLDPFTSSAEVAPSSTVDAQGAFRFDGLPAGDLEVTLVSGIASAREEGWGTNAAHLPARPLGSVAIRAGAVTETVFDLGPNVPGAVAATVSVNGRPASDFLLKAYASGAGRSQEWSELQRMTDARGRAELSPLFPGEWRLEVTAADRSGSYDQPAAVSVASGARIEVLVDVPLVEGELFVLDVATGKPLGGRSVDLRPERGGYIVRGKLDEQGRTRIALPVGRYYASDAGDGAGLYVPPDPGVLVVWALQGPIPATLELTKAEPYKP